MFAQVAVGAPGNNSDTTFPVMGGDKQGAGLVSELHAPYYNLTYRGKCFSAANQAAQATTVALATTYTGIVISNPLGSGVNLEMLLASWALSVAPAAIATIGLITGFSGTTNVTHTTPLTPVSDVVGGGNGLALADSSATIVGTPRWHHQLMGGFTAAALPSSPQVLFDLKGAIIVPPGGYIAIGSLTAVTGLGSFKWAESPI
jgi:hypothetical protein